MLGIPFYVWDMAARFREDVIEDFVAEYAAGRTPNPCLRCNEKIKFAALLDKALALGFDAVATGHYAQVVERAGRAARAAPGGRHGQGPVLRPRRPRRGPARAVVLPARRHHQARRSARRPRERGFYVARQARQPRHLLHRRRRHPRVAGRAGSASSPATSSTPTATVLGAARGAPTRSPSGQRTGPAPRPARRRRRRRATSSQVQPRSNTVVVGTADLLGVDALTGDHARWCGPPPRGRRRVGAQVRAHGEEVPATAWADGERVEVRLERRIRGVAPGQSVVLYDGTRVVGSATISAATTSR